jgi:thiamine pyrophosphate-dependent acetolactate synthase large subunit-like protein
MAKRMTSEGKPEGANQPIWASDVMAATLRELGFPYVALVPGASYAALHDSLVNYLGNHDPKILLCLHEEHAAFLGSGYAQVTGEPMLIIVHTNVGLMHASMGIFDCWCGRQPLVVIGTAAFDAETRTPWIEWIHSSSDQAGMVRGFVKWDDEPHSIGAAIDSLRRATLLARAEPPGPTLVTLDRGLQEQELGAWPEKDKLARFQPPGPSEPAAADVARALDLIKAAKKPVLLAGRVSRSEDAWAARIRFAELLGAQVLTYADDGAAFPIPHPRHAGRFGLRVNPKAKALLRDADLLIELDWVDFGSLLRQVWTQGETPTTIISCANDHLAHRGWNKDYFTFAPADVRLGASPDRAIAALLKGLEGRKPAPALASVPALPKVELPGSGRITIRMLAQAFYDLIASESVCVAEIPIGWPADLVRCSHPLDLLAGASGGDVGAGPGTAIGAALALRHQGSKRLPLAVMGDGDFLMGVGALWVAAANHIPFLIVVANNRAYGNDVQAQERTARKRGRPVENKWIGQAITDPPPDLSGLARDFGCEGAGPIADIAQLRPALETALARLKAGAGYVLDVVIAED